MTSKATIGSISSGTLRDYDLACAFSDELESLTSEPVTNLGAPAEAWESDEHEYWQSDEACFLVGELSDMLNELAPPYCYFGALMGDGADFGFWADIDSLEEDARNGEVVKVEDTGELAGMISESGLVMHVNDHGNVTLYRVVNVELEEVWSVV